MLRIRAILLIGVWVALLPYGGFPPKVENLLFSLTGLCLIYMSLVMYKQVKRAKGNTKTIDSFSENGSSPKSEEIEVEQVIIEMEDGGRDGMDRSKNNVLEL